jgi:1A family penicillin-binding protein
MRVLTRLTLFIASFLIWIGDIVLFLGTLLFRSVSLVLRVIFRLFTLPARGVKHLIKPFNKPRQIDIYKADIAYSRANVMRKKAVLMRRAYKSPSTPFKIRFSLPKLSWEKRKKRKPIVKIKERRVVRRIVLKHIPLLAKFKYFTVGTLFSLFFFFLPLLVFVFIQELPSPRGIWIGQIPQTTKMYDRNGVLLYQLYASQNRTVVPIDMIPKTLQEATIAIEDKDFYKHPGFDITAIIRSIIGNTSGQELQGGSTITQQLIKSALLTPETSVQRKIKEIILAFWTERMYSKNQILEMYFNQIPYGGTAWGVEAAAETYFGKSVKDLTLAESAFLAGIPRAPSIYSPHGLYPQLWKKRQKEVLSRMVTLGYISKEKSQEAEAEELEFKPPLSPLHAPHFVMYVRNFLIRKYGLPLVEKGGLSVTTTLDLKMQEAIQKIVTDEVNSSVNLNLTNGATLVTNPKNGDVIAMVGSKDYTDPESGNVNLTTSLRQPGSTVKVITYAMALEKGYTAATPIDDSPITLIGPGGVPYSPVNYDGKSHGVMPLRYTLANSFNIAAVRTIHNLGVAPMVTLAKRMGIRSWGSPDNYGYPVTLGSAEATMIDMATAFGTVANLGSKIDINPVLKIADYKGNVLEEKQPETGVRVLDEGIAYILSDILADNGARALEFGTNSPLYIPGQYVSVKTGTSDNKRDNWTIGYTPNFVVAVWVGNNDNSPMSQQLASGITGAAPIWNKVMTLLLRGQRAERGSIPANVIQKSCQGRIEYFIKGTENTVNCAPPRPSPTPTPNP